jgi:toxin ParE1/3/4
MARYNLSKVADAKIAAIYGYSILHFSEGQADEYFLGMHALFETLAVRPFLGRATVELGGDVRRFVYRAHVIFYKPVLDGIFVIDIFGVRQFPHAPLGGGSSDLHADTDEMPETEE